MDWRTTVTAMNETHPRTRARGSASNVNDELLTRSGTVIAWLATLIVVYGTVMVFSASTVLSYKNHGNAYHYGIRHVAAVVIGTLLAVWLRRFRASSWRKLAKVLLGVSVALQLVALVHGAAIGGQRNWINVGVTTIQPSEFAKIGLILALAMVLAVNQEQGQPWNRIWLSATVITAVVVGLVVVGGDLGTPIVLGGIAVGMIFLAGAQLKPLIYLFGLAALLGVASISVKGYRMDRISAWFDPFHYKSEAGYQAVHGRFALGGGGLLGEGLGSGREKWGGLPAAHTDFILAATGEETGLLGATAMIGILIALVLTILRVALLQQDPFSRYVCGGIAVWFSVQALINIAMVVGWAPVVGITLPLVSFGGSSMVATLAAVGIVLSMCQSEAGSGRKVLRRRSRRTAT
jgi:cell division protein FtsW